MDKPKYIVNDLSHFQGCFSGIVYATEHREKPVSKLHIRTPYDCGGHDTSGQPGVRKGTTVGFVNIARNAGLPSEVQISYCKAPYGEEERFSIKKSGEITAEKDLRGYDGTLIKTDMYKNSSANVQKVFTYLEAVIHELACGKDVELGMYLKNF